jgi:poly(A) polymerase/tRNA nucleotidyltransferase (CCA-adding enzyme)
MDLSTNEQALRALAAFFRARGVDAWLVGGTVRDMALGRPGDDIDVAAAGDGVALARAFADEAGGAFVPLDEGRGTGRAVLGAYDAGGGPRLTVDIARLRGGSIEADLRARDFTINAVALPLGAALDQGAWRAASIDPCGGLADLGARTLRACGDESLRDDPLRLLRAVRLAAGLGLTVSAELEAQLRRDAPLAARPAAERVRDELLKLLASPAAAAWLRFSDAVGMLTVIFPELEPARETDQPRVHFLPVLAHSLEAVAAADWMLAQLGAQPAPADPLPAPQLPEAVRAHPQLGLVLRHADALRAHFAGAVGGAPRVALFKLATLLHDNAKPQTKRAKPEGGVSFYDHQIIGADVARAIGQRLRLSRGATAYVAGVVRAHMRPGQLGTQPVTLRAALRLFRDTGGAAEGTAPYGPDVLLHAMADHMATRGPLISVQGWEDHAAWTDALLDVYWAQPEAPAAPLLDGTQLMAALGIGPGPRVGELLREVHEAQAAGEIATADEALALARRLHEA